jgi:hypothetical protein
LGKNERTARGEQVLGLRTARVDRFRACIEDQRYQLDALILKEFGANLQKSIV